MIVWVWAFGLWSSLGTEVEHYVVVQSLSCVQLCGFVNGIIKGLKYCISTSLVVQWLGHCTSNAGDVSLIPGLGTKIPHATRHDQKVNKIKYFLLHVDTDNTMWLNHSVVSNSL